MSITEPPSLFPCNYLRLGCRTRPVLTRGWPHWLMSWLMARTLLQWPAQESRECPGLSLTLTFDLVLEFDVVSLRFDRLPQFPSRAAVSYANCCCCCCRCFSLLPLKEIVCKNVAVFLFARYLKLNYWTH